MPRYPVLLPLSSRSVSALGLAAPGSIAESSVRLLVTCPTIVVIHVVFYSRIFMLIHNFISFLFLSSPICLLQYFGASFVLLSSSGEDVFFRWGIELYMLLNRGARC